MAQSQMGACTLGHLSPRVDTGGQCGQRLPQPPNTRGHGSFQATTHLSTGPLWMPFPKVNLRRQNSTKSHESLTCRGKENLIGKMGMRMRGRRTPEILTCPGTGSRGDCPRLWTQCGLECSHWRSAGGYWLSISAQPGTCSPHRLLWPRSQIS